jgi:hypothetical protein
VVAKWEGELGKGEPLPAPGRAAHAAA